MPGRGDDGGVPVDLYRLRHECRARWEHVDDLGGEHMWLTVGELDDGRWYVDTLGEPVERCRVYPTKAQAWGVARAWMTARGGPWKRIACYPVTSTGQ